MEGDERPGPSEARQHRTAADRDARSPDPAAPATDDATVARLHQALAAADARARVLADELHHRIRNMLATVRSIARQTWEEGASQQEYAQHLQGRLDAVARYQAHLGLDGAGGVELEDIVRDELLAAHQHEGRHCTIDGPPVRLHGKQAELFGLAIHELVVNAIKFGALARDGRLAIAWSVDDDELRFRWAEAGVAIAASAPRPCGFGSRLIEEGLPYQLGATTSLAFRPGGVACAIDVRLPGAGTVAQGPASAATQPLSSSHRLGPQP